MTATSYQRNVETRRTVAGVRTDPTHWANTSVHAFRQWTDESTLETWCGLTIDVSGAGRQTTDLVSCLSCAEASWKAFHPVAGGAG